MGFYPKNKATITRVYDPKREIVVEVWDEVSQKFKSERFGFEAMSLALDWLQKELEEVCM